MAHTGAAAFGCLPAVIPAVIGAAAAAGGFGFVVYRFGAQQDECEDMRFRQYNDRSCMKYAVCARPEEYATKFTITYL